MPAEHISAAEAKAKFAYLIEGVHHRGMHYVIERHGRPVAAIVSVPELRQLEEERPASARPGGAMALVGLWGDIPESTLDSVLLDLLAARQADEPRSVSLEP